MEIMCRTCKYYENLTSCENRGFCLERYKIEELRGYVHPKYPYLKFHYPHYKYYFWKPKNDMDIVLLTDKDFEL
jgi:hypothetical protein